MIGIFNKVQIKFLLHHVALEKLLGLSRNGPPGVQNIKTNDPKTYWQLIVSAQ